MSERLTRFNNLTKEYEYHLNNPNTSMVQDEIAGIQKLGQLEDIEEQLGIDLITLLKVQTTGAYFKGADRKWKPTTYYDEKCFVVHETEIYRFYFKDYGKTWSLNKEDLQ